MNTHMLAPAQVVCLFRTPSQCNAPSPTADDGEAAKPYVPLELVGKTTRNCPKGGGTTNDEHYGCNKDSKADTVAAS